MSEIEDLVAKLSIERDELRIKSIHLEKALRTKPWINTETEAMMIATGQRLLELQALVMLSYENILEMRITELMKAWGGNHADRTEDD